MFKKNCLMLGVAAVAFAAPAISSAALLVDFEPVTPGTNINISGSPGSKTVTVTSVLVNLRSSINLPTLSGPIIDGYEVFEDTTLSMVFNETGANALSLGGGGLRTVGGWRFVFTASGTYGGAVLLSGTFGPSSLFGVGGVGSVLSPTVTYVGGLLTPILPSPTGDSTFSLSLVNPGFSVSGGSVAGFSARLQGQLTTPVIPEPASMGMAGVAAGAMLVRRRRA